MKFQYKYRVAWVDTDALGVMHFSNYFRMCERTEEEFMNSIGLSFDISKSVSLPRVKAECTYKSPLMYNDTALVSMSIKEVGKKHIRYYFEIIRERDGKLAATCELVVVAINNEFKSIEIPKELLERIRSFLPEDDAVEKG